MYELELLIREFLQEDFLTAIYRNFFLPIELKGKRFNEDSDWVFI
jgi:hypothetical protein|tara:strand:- start:3613 stop:3747 length:135 start_codon:yes stop_codon:yes gene_type:complete